MWVRELAKTVVFGTLLWLVLIPVAFASTPAIVTSQSYLNGPQTAHTTAGFDSTGATTLVAFIGTYSNWSGLPVSISSVSDNLNNSWQVLSGPTSWTNPTGGTPMLAAVYYVNAPVTSNQQTITVTLTNATPLVLHVFAVSGSDTTAPPVSAPITDPGLTAGGTDVPSQAISVSAGTLLLGFAKNQNSINSAIALNGFTLDRKSSSFLWAESKTVSAAGSDSAHFQFSEATGWQTTVVGIKPAGTTLALVPVVLSSKGYISGTPLTTHTTAAFNSTGATTLVAFIGTHPTWSGPAVSISSVTDNLNNSWQVLNGPTAWTNTTGTPLLAAVYYVNAPVTSSQQTITVTLTNAAPLVLHVFAVSGSDISNPPISAAITDPGPNGATSDVLSQAINAPAGSLLLSWAKNQDNVTSVSALDGFMLDPESTGFLSAESQTVFTTGSYAAHFQFSPAVGWQTTVVSLGPVRAYPTVTWTNPADITYGTPLNATQLNATADVDGTFTYSPASGTVMSAGTGQTLSVTFTPSDTSSFTTVTKTVTINVRKASASVTPANATKVYGTADPALTGELQGFLSSDNVKAVFSRTSGEEVATDPYTISGTLSPVDVLANYDVTYNTALFTIVKAALTVTAQNATRIFGAANPSLTATYAGFVNGDSSTSLGGTLTFTTTATTSSPVGTYSITPSGLTSTNYTISFVPGALTITAASPTIVWSNPGTIIFGTPLSATQLNATASVNGAFTYSPPAGTVLGAGSGQKLSVAFTPADAKDYNAQNATVLINVQQAMPTIVWATPADITQGTALSSTQLNAVAISPVTGAPVPGTYQYTPSLGAPMPPGVNQLTVTFTPIDALDYFGPVTGSVRINVDLADVSGNVTANSGVPGADTLTTGDTTTATVPVQTSLTSPVSGTASIIETATTQPAPSGYTFFGQQVNITAPAGSPTSPLTLVFTLDSSLIAAGQNQDTTQVFRDGTLVADCTSKASPIAPVPCVSNRTLLSNGNVQLTVLTDHATVWNYGKSLRNSPPVAAADSYTTTADTALTVTAPGVLANDTDPDRNTLYVDKTSTPSHGTLTVNANGSFTYSPAPGFSGTDSFTYYAYDGQVDSTTSATVTITVNQAGTNTSISSNLNPAVYAQSVTFTATVSSSSLNIAPTGTVTFTDGSTTLGTAPLSSGGAAATASYSIATLGAAPHAISAIYSGDSIFASSTSQALTETINQVSQTITVTSTLPSSESYNSTFNLSATGGASGNDVTFAVDSSSTACSIGNVTKANGTFTAPITMTSGIGSCVVNLNQTGGTNYTAAPQVPVTIAAAKAAASTLTITGPTSVTYGSTGTATVSGGSGTGAVTFSAGPSTGCSVSGTTVSVTNASGTCVLVATQAADSNYSQATSATFTVTLNKTASTVMLAPSANPSTAGQSITMTATLNNASATGTVTFYDGSTILGTGTLNNGTATLTTSALSAGAHTLKANYGGDGNFAASASPGISEVVNAKSTTTSMTSGPNPSAVGQAVTLSANVNGVGGTPTGSVSFKDGNTVLGIGTLSNGQTTLTTSFSAAGAHSVTATYSGDTMFGSSTSAVVSQTVTGNVASSVGTPTSSASTSTYGQSVTFTATVSATAGTPTGTLTFLDGGTAIGSVTLNAAGSGSFTTTALNAGTHSITASYSGDGTFASSSSAAALAQAVNKTTATASSFTFIPSPQQYSDPVTFKATFAPGPNNTSPATAATFKVGTQVMGTQNFVFNSSTGLYESVLTVPLLESVSGQMSPGAKTVIAQFTANPNYTVSNRTGSLSVTAEDARTYFAGASSVLTNPGTSTATISLQWTIKDITAVGTSDAAYDAYPGNISLAKASFVNRATGAIIATVPITLVSDPSSPANTVGTASYNWSVDIGTATSQTYTVGVMVTGYYTRNSTTENATITVNKQ